MSILNKDSNPYASGGKRLFVDFIHLILNTAPASATSGRFAVKTDFGSIRGSAGTLLTAGNGSTGDAVDGVSEMRVGPTVAAASGNARSLCHGVTRSVIPVTLDEFFFVFGTVDKSMMTSLGGAVAQKIVLPCPPLILEPGNSHQAFVHLWHPANAATAPTYEVGAIWYALR